MIYQVKVTEKESQALQSVALQAGYIWSYLTKDSNTEINTNVKFLYLHPKTSTVTANDSYINNKKRYTDKSPKEMFQILTKEPEKPIMVGEHTVSFEKCGVKIGCQFFDKSTIENIYRKCYPRDTLMSCDGCCVELSFGHVHKVVVTVGSEPSLEVAAKTVQKIYQRMKEV